ncbi:MAG: gliding motility-associated C-terminal domain-containing protein [Bacteroidetes bacterium]|nr:gliding motility-associated C-terminal domain-containing protein [Bacteroidota bacterium]
MTRVKLIFQCIFFLCFIKGGSLVQAQCIVINEILINGPGSCDGSCNPSTEEWTELYNTCSTPVNIGCFVLSDGEFTVTIPQGTILAANDYYVIGSPNSGGTVDLNLATCNCASGTLIGTYSNSDEQTVLFNGSGAIVDAVYWGNGDFPMNISSGGPGACSNVNVNISNVSTAFEHLPTPGTNGCSVARKCDGSSVWEQRCAPLMSINATNGAPLVPAFIASDTTICPSNCVNYTNLSTGTATSWLWSFAGASPISSSTAYSPNFICYVSNGSYTVTLQGTNGCGTFTLTKPGYITVSSIPVPQISPSAPQAFCPGDSVLLSSTVGAGYQWKLNNVNIPGATQQTLWAKTPGSYSVKIGSGNCTNTSPPVTVSLSALPTATISANGPTTICTGGTSSLSAGSGFNSYAWLFNNALLSGETASTLSVSNPGNYTVIVTNSNGCKDTSLATTIGFSTGFSVTILATDTVFCKGKNVQLSLSASYPTVLWSTGENTPTIAVTLGGKYSVIASNSAGCSGKDTIRVRMLPAPSANAGKDTLADCTNGAKLNGSSSGTTFLWSPSDGLDDPTVLNPIAKPESTTTYTLTVSDALCSWSDEVLVTVDCGNLYIPNSFSPNGDGMNDYFKALGNNVTEFEMRIYNRWGELIFESTQINQAWDGTYMNYPAPSGVYVREIKAVNPLGKKLLSDAMRFGTIVLYR